MIPLVPLQHDLMSDASQAPACKLLKGISLQVCLVQGSADKQPSLYDNCLPERLRLLRRC